MNYTGILVGAAAGALGALVCAGILKLLGKSAGSSGATALYVVIFLLTTTLGREVIEPRIQARQVETALLKLPIYRALQQHEPEAYARIRKGIEYGIAHKQPMEQMWATTRPVVGEVVSRRLPHASDDTLAAFGQHFVAAMTTLYARGGNACFSYVNPAPGEAVNFNALLGKDLSERELDVVAQIVTSAAGKTRPQVSDAEAAPDLEVVITRLLTRFSPADLALLKNPNAPGVDKRHFCELITAVYQESVALPAPQNARLIRYLAQGS